MQVAHSGNVHHTIDQCCRQLCGQQARCCAEHCTGLLSRMCGGMLLNLHRLRFLCIWLQVQDSVVDEDGEAPTHCLVTGATRAELEVNGGCRCGRLSCCFACSLDSLSWTAVWTGCCFLSRGAPLRMRSIATAIDPLHLSSLCAGLEPAARHPERRQENVQRM